MNENELSELIRDAVAGIDPEDRLVELRRRTATPARRARPWLYAAAGVAVATAATVAAFAVVGVVGTDDGPMPAGRDRTAHDQSGQPEDDAQLVPAYFLGDTPRGTRLFREFDEVPAGDRLQAAVDRLQQQPADPDYVSSWPAGSLKGAVVGDGTIDVELGASRALRTDALGVQQVVYTLQGTVHEQLPVRFVRDGQVVLGPVTARPELEVLNPVNISDPVEGAAYDGAFIARGRGNAPDETVTWNLRARSGAVVRSGVTDVTGTDDRLYPWETRIDLEGLPAGTYTFSTLVERPVDATSIQATDTRTITVR